MLKVNPKFHLNREVYPPARDNGTSYRETGWQQRAACSTAGLPAEEAKRRQELFAMRGPSSFHRYSQHPQQHPQVREALSFCERCPVLRECEEQRRSTTDFAMTGIWAGRYWSYERAKDALAQAREHQPHQRHTPNGWD